MNFAVIEMLTHLKISILLKECFKSVGVSRIFKEGYSKASENLSHSVLLGTWSHLALGHTWHLITLETYSDKYYDKFYRKYEQKEKITQK